MSQGETQALVEIAEVNPATNVHQVLPDARVSFIPMSDVSEDGRWVVKSEAPLKDVRVGYTAFAEGDVLFAKITPCMENGKGAHAVGLVNGIGFGSTEFHVLRVRGDNSPRFLFHWLQSPLCRNRAIAYMGGSAGQQRVQAEFFSRFRVPRIEPADQSRIGAVLDSVDDLIATTEAVIAKLKQVRAGLLHDLLSCGLDEHGQLRDPIAHPEQFQDSPLGHIPTAWRCESLENAAEWASGGTPSRSQGKLWTGDVPLLTPKDMKAFELSDTIEHVTLDGAVAGSKMMPAQTIFIVVRGMILAHTFPVCINTRPFAFNQDIKAVRGRAGVSNRYLGHWFSANSAMFLRKATEATHGTKKLEMEELYRVRIALPPPAEQEAVVAKIDSIDATIALDTSELKKLKMIKSGILSDLLTGRVRVPPEAAEPA